MAVARVPLVPVTPGADLVKVGWAVDGRTHQALAAGVNNLLGRGGQLIPPFGVRDAIAPGATLELEFKIWPRLQAWRRLWCVWMHRAESGIGGQVTVTPGSASAIEVEVSAPRTQAPFMFIEALGARTAVETTTTITIDNDAATGDVYVETVGCVEIPRPSLPADATDYGVEIETCRMGAPIFDGVGASYGGLLDSLVQAETTARRNGLFHWSVDVDSALVFTTSSTSPVALFAVDPLMLARKRYRTSTTGVVSWEIYARASNGTTSGRVDFSAASGAGMSINIPLGTTAWTWFGNTLAVDCEDLTDPAGLQGSAFDSVAVEALRTAGAGSISIAAVNAGEAP